VDLAGPVIRLQSLTPEDLVVLLQNIATVHANGDATKWRVPREAILAVLERASATLGAEFFRTPRDVVRAFVGLLDILEQNPSLKWEALVGEDFIRRPETALSAEESAPVPDLPTENAGADDLATFKL